MPWYKDKILLLIALAAGTLKLAGFLYLFFFHPLGEQALIFPDSLGYIFPAQSWLTYGQFWEAVSSAPMVLPTPGYPFFLALVHLFTGSSTWGVVVTQNILATVLLLPVYLTTRELAGTHAARWAAGFCAASTLYFSLAFAVLTETLCAFLLAWFVWAVAYWLNAKKPFYLAVAAVSLAGAIYVRPVVYYLMIPLSVVLLLTAPRPQRKPLLACFIAPLVLLVGAWHVRNYTQTGYAGFSTVGAYNLYIWNEDYLARHLHITVPQAHEQLLAQLPENFNQLSVPQQVRTYKNLAAPLLKQSFLDKLLHVPLWAGKTLLGTNFVHLSRLIFGQAEDPQQTLNQTGLLPRPWLQSAGAHLLWLGLLCGSILLAICGGWGLIILWKNNRQAALFLAGYIVYFWALGSSFLGAYARMRAPFEFALCITAGICLHHQLSRQSSGR